MQPPWSMLRSRIRARGGAAGHPGPQHRHLGRRHAGQSPQQDAAAAVVVLQQPGGNLHRHAAADLAEGRHDGPFPRILLNQLVGQGGELLLGDPLQLVLPGGGQVQEPGQRRAFPHALQLPGQRAGELERQIRPAEELLGAVDDLGALPAVVLIAKPGADARTVLHVHPVPVLQEERHAGRRQTDPVLVRTAFLGNSDDHVALRHQAGCPIIQCGPPAVKREVSGLRPTELRPSRTKAGVEEYLVLRPDWP